MSKETNISACQSSGRAYYLDNLKTFLTVMVILHHVSVGYLHGSGWSYHPTIEGDYVGWIGHFLSVNASFLMGLYFLISGYFVPGSLDRHGALSFVKGKLLRLGVPMLFMATVLSLLSHHLDFGHTWFLQHLLLYSLVYVALRQLPNRTVGTRDRKISLAVPIALAAVIGLYGYLVRPVFPQDRWIAAFGSVNTEVAHVFQYVALFAAGIVAYRRRWLNNMSHAVGAVCLLTGVVMATLSYHNALYGFLWSNGQRYWGIYEGFMSVSLSFGLVWLFREIGNGTSRFLQWASAQAYGAYIFHLLIVIGFQHVFDRVAMGGGEVKIIVIGICSVIVSFLFSALVRAIPGMKRIL